MKMKKVLVLVLFMAFVVNSMVAQAPKVSREQRLKMRLEQLKSELNLNDSQVKQIETLFTAQDEQMKDLRKNGEASRDQNRDKMKQLRNERETKMKEILTPEQYPKFVESQKEMFKKEMKMRRENAPKADSVAVKEVKKEVKAKKSKKDAPSAE